MLLQESISVEGQQQAGVNPMMSGALPCNVKGQTHWMNSLALFLWKGEPQQLHQGSQSQYEVDNLGNQ